ncbi:MAG: cytidylate kinase-like family protein [Lachnospiraceae bacterium]|nr:cytidylate kinase-like family protein [Lachnospiraceae bacterium]
MEKYVITIARGFGSGGKTIAMKLAETLGINCYEHRIEMLASQYSGEEENRFFETFSNASMVNTLGRIPITRAVIPVISRFSGDKKMYEIQSQIIHKVADEESCVIVGKCADYVLRDRENVIRIYSDAPREYCISRVMQRIPGITSSEANKLIAKTDRYRSDYYKFYTGRDWRDMTNFDLTINTQKMGIDAAIHLIEKYLEEKHIL